MAASGYSLSERDCRWLVSSITEIGSLNDGLPPLISSNKALSNVFEVR